MGVRMPTTTRSRRPTRCFIVCIAVATTAVLGCFRGVSVAAFAMRRTVAIPSRRSAMLRGGIAIAGPLWFTSYENPAVAFSKVSAEDLYAAVDEEAIKKMGNPKQELMKSSQELKDLASAFDAKDWPLINTVFARNFPIIKVTMPYLARESQAPASVAFINHVNDLVDELAERAFYLNWDGTSVPKTSRWLKFKMSHKKLVGCVDRFLMTV